MELHIIDIAKLKKKKMNTVLIFFRKVVSYEVQVRIKNGLNSGSDVWSRWVHSI